MSTASLAKTHENYSPDWWTPREWLAWVEATIGSDYYDPCPAYWDGKFSELHEDWASDVYCNHPGSRGSTVAWWEKFVDEMHEWAKGKHRVHVPHGPRYIWCGFNIEQLRHMHPSPFHLPGWLVMPRTRVAFVDGRTGEVAKSPSNWTFFWTNVPPATPPVESVIVRTS